MENKIIKIVISIFLLNRVAYAGVLDSVIEKIKQENLMLLSEMIPIKGGCFLMGSPETESASSDDKRLHQVCVKNFEIGKYELTQAQWQSVMGTNPSKFKTPNRPVEQVSWYDVQKFLQKLNVKTGKNYRLPTEAEWEYAARAGTTTAFYAGNNITDKQANFNYKAAGKTTIVGSYPPNPWGLYDITGNVWEWTCSDYDENYTGNEIKCVNNSRKPRVLRGGGYGEEILDDLRTASRFKMTPSYSSNSIGFRLVLDLPESSPDGMK